MCAHAEMADVNAADSWQLLCVRQAASAARQCAEALRSNSSCWDKVSAEEFTLRFSAAFSASFHRELRSTGLCNEGGGGECGPDGMGNMALVKFAPRPPSDIAQYKNVLSGQVENCEKDHVESSACQQECIDCVSVQPGRSVCEESVRSSSRDLIEWSEREVEGSRVYRSLLAGIGRLRRSARRAGGCPQTLPNSGGSVVRVSVRLLQEGRLRQLRALGWQPVLVQLLSSAGESRLEVREEAGGLAEAGLACSTLLEATATEIGDCHHVLVLRGSRVELVLQMTSADQLQSWLKLLRAAAPQLTDQRVSPDHTGHVTADDDRCEVSRLADYPWFHGLLSREHASVLVLQEGEDGHGTFLLRQSSSRAGQLVLTFNHTGRAKHLRLLLSSDPGPGVRCMAEHLSFGSVTAALEYFRRHPLPLEGGGSSGVTLAEFILRDHAQADSRPVRTYGGSVRLRTASLERLERQQTASLDGQQGVTNSSSRNTLAPENHYSLS